VSFYSEYHSLHTNIYICVCVSICINMFVCIYIFIYIHIYIYMDTLGNEDSIYFYFKSVKYLVQKKTIFYFNSGIKVSPILRSKALSIRQYVYQC